MTFSRLFSLWLPVLGERLALAIELPLLLMLIGLSADSAYPVAVFGMAYAVFGWFESPFMMSESIFIKHKDKLDHQRTLFNRHFKSSLSIMLLIFTVFSLPIAFESDFLTKFWIETMTCILIMLPILPASAHRRLQQGLLIINHEKSLITTALIIKTVTLVAVAVPGVLWLNVPLFHITATALVVGVYSEVIYIHFKYQHKMNTFKQSGTKSTYTTQNWLAEMAPLALMSFSSFGIGSISALYVGLSKNAVTFVAIYSLSNACTYLLKNIPFSIQPLWIKSLGGSLLEQMQNRKLFIVMALFCVVVSVIGIEFFSYWYFVEKNHIDERFFYDCKLAAYFLAASVVLSFPIIYYRGKLIHESKNVAITSLVIIEFSSFLLTLLLTNEQNLNHLAVCCTAVVTGRLVAIIYLIFFYAMSPKSKEAVHSRITLKKNDN